MDRWQIVWRTKEPVRRRLGRLAGLVLASLLLLSWVPGHPLSRTLAGTARQATADTATLKAGTVPTYAVTLAGRLYVSNCADNTVSVLDETSQATVATIPVGRCPLAIAANPLTNRVYVADSTDQAISVINATTNQVIGAPLPVFVHVDGALAVDPASNRVYAGDADGNTLTTLDGSTGYVFPGPLGVITVGNNVAGVAVGPAGDVYASNFGDGTVSHLDPDGNLVGAPIPIGQEADLLALDGATHRLYVVNSAAGSVTVVDTGSDTVLGSPIPVGGNPQGIGVDTALHHVYVANQVDSTISVIDEASAAVLGTIPTSAAPSGLAVDQARHALYVTYPDADQLGVLTDPFVPGYVTPTPSPTQSATVTATATDSPTSTPSATATATATDSPTSTPTATVTSTSTPSATSTNTPTSTPIPVQASGAVVVLDTGGSDCHLTVQGGTVTAGSVAVNGTSANALCLNSGSVRATTISLQGGVRNQGGTLSGTVNTNQPLSPDPLAGLPAPGLPSAVCPGAACPEGTNFNSSSYRLLPGHFTSGLNINSGTTVCLSPGVYYLDGTWNVNGRLSPYGSAGCPALPAGVTDAGVLLYFHGGTLQLNSGADLSTMQAMATGPYAGLLYWQVSGSAVYENAPFLGGAWYEPAGSLTLNSGASLSAGAVIAQDLTVNGGATLTARTGG